jgi:hypothetical protein
VSGHRHAGPGCRGAGRASWGQWACIAAEADDLLAVIAEEAAKNVGGRPSKDQIAVLSAELLDRDELKAKPTQKIAPLSKDERATATKAAELFNTNRTTSPRPRGSADSSW